MYTILVTPGGQGPDYTWLGPGQWDMWRPLGYKSCNFEATETEHPLGEGACNFTFGEGKMREVDFTDVIDEFASRKVRKVSIS